MAEETSKKKREKKKEYGAKKGKGRVIQGLVLLGNLN